jgi:hypothetical protein
MADSSIPFAVAANNNEGNMMEDLLNLQKQL